MCLTFSQPWRLNFQKVCGEFESAVWWNMCTWPCIVWAGCCGNCGVWHGNWQAWRSLCHPPHTEQVHGEPVPGKWPGRSVCGSLIPLSSHCCHCLSLTAATISHSDKPQAWWWSATCQCYFTICVCVCALCICIQFLSGVNVHYFVEFFLRYHSFVLLSPLL